MDTFAAAFIEEFDERWREVDVLIQHAKLARGSGEIHDALCRSAIVMISAHLEGDLKEFIKALISDVNKFSKFRHCRTQIKKHFVRHLMNSGDEKISKQMNEKENHLIQLLSDLNATLETEPFAHIGGNPTPANIDKIFEPLGTKQTFAGIGGSVFESVFESTSPDGASQSAVIDVEQAAASAEGPMAVSESEEALPNTDAERSLTISEPYAAVVLTAEKVELDAIGTEVTKAAMPIAVAMPAVNDADTASESSSTVSESLRALKDHLQTGLKSYPYAIDLNLFQIDEERERKIRERQGAADSLWGTFLDDLLGQRHSIAHGSSLQNSKSYEELERMRQKTEILFHLIVLLVAKNFVSEMPASAQINI